MISIETAGAFAEGRLNEAGWGRRGLDNVTFPEVEFAEDARNDAVPYTILGDESAPHVIVETTPYFTELGSKHYLLRLMAQQAALGKDFCIVGVEAYHPSKTYIIKEDRPQIADGDFSRLSHRVLRVVDMLILDDESKLSLYGYSFGADMSAQTATEMLTSPSRGVAQLEALGVVEPARSDKRSAKDVRAAMQSSGKHLYGNILASNMPALDEAWGITRGNRWNERLFNPSVVVGLAKYLGHQAFTNRALVHGFANDKTLEQAQVLLEAGVPVYAGRQTQSAVCPESFITQLVDFGGEHAPETPLYITQEQNDHSADDNLRRSAARAFYFSEAIYHSLSVTQKAAQTQS